MCFRLVCLSPSNFPNTDFSPIYIFNVLKIRMVTNFHRCIQTCIINQNVPILFDQFSNFQTPHFYKEKHRKDASELPVSALSHVDSSKNPNTHTHTQSRRAARAPNI